MAYEIETPENMDAGGSDFIDKTGWYHLAVSAIDENPTDKKGQMLSAFKSSVYVLGGEQRDQEKRTAELTFWNPKPTDKNNGEMAKKKQARFLTATCVIDPTAKLAPGQKMVVDLSTAIGRQFVARIEMRESDGGKKYPDLHFADLYHIDDPAVKYVPKNESAIRMLGKELRRDPASFVKSDGTPSTPIAMLPDSQKTSAGNGSSTSSLPPAKRAANAPAPLDVNDPSLSF